MAWQWSGRWRCRHLGGLSSRKRLSGGYPTFNSDARCPHIQARVCKGFTLTIPRANRGRAGPHVGGHRATWAREGKCGRHPQGLEGRSRGLDGEDRSSARRKRDLNPALFCYCSRNGGDGELARAANVSERSLAQVQARPRSQARAPGPDLRSGPDLRPGPQAPITEARASGPVHGPSCGDPGVCHTGHIDGLHDDGHLGSGWFCGRPGDPWCAQGGARRDRQFELPARQHLTALRSVGSTAKLALLERTISPEGDLRYQSS